jgi:hypothetical protein
MALTKCKECGTEISSKAESCPKCGAKNVKHYGCGTLILILIILGIFVGLFSGGSDTSTSQTQTTPPPQQEVALTPKGKIIKAKHPAWKNDVCNTVANKQVYIGMNAEQAKAAWGKPYKINETTGTYGTHQQWVMHEYGNTYLYFQNGILTSIQQSK